MTSPAAGRQNERTALAWQRTALSLLAGAVVLSRLTYDRLGFLSLSSLALALPLCLWVFVESRGRYRHDAGIRLRPSPRGGRAPAVLTAGLACLALTELAAIVRSA